MEYSDTTDDLAYITSLEQRVYDLEVALSESEFLLRFLGINWKEAEKVSDSAIRLANCIHEILEKDIK